MQNIKAIGTYKKRKMLLASADYAIQPLDLLFGYVRAVRQKTGLEIIRCLSELRNGLVRIDKSITSYINGCLITMAQLKNVATAALLSFRNGLIKVVSTNGIYQIGFNFVLPAMFILIGGNYE